MQNDLPFYTVIYPIMPTLVTVLGLTPCFRSIQPQVLGKKNG